MPALFVAHSKRSANPRGAGLADLSTDVLRLIAAQQPQAGAKLRMLTRAHRAMIGEVIPHEQYLMRLGLPDRLHGHANSP